MDQIVLNAVALGKTAESRETGGLFTAVLLAKLKEAGAWPNDLHTFYKDLSAAVVKEGGSSALCPRISIRSRLYSDDPPLAGPGRRPEIQELVDVLLTCNISPADYKRHYIRTVGSILADPEARHAESIVRMLDILSALPGEEDYGGHPQLLMDFLMRLQRSLPVFLQPLSTWVDAHLPNVGRAALKHKLDREEADLVLHMIIVESPAGEAYPATVECSLTDATFTNIIRSWTSGRLQSEAELMSFCQQLLAEAQVQQRKLKVGMSIQIFANPPLLCVPYQDLPVDPDDEESNSFGQLYPIVLRSRGRLSADSRYDLETWRNNVLELNANACNEIALHTAPPYAKGVGDALARIQGMLIIRESFPPCAPSHKLLGIALKKGLPLLSWRFQPEPDRWTDFETHLKNLLSACNSLGQAPLKLKDQRKCEPWARDTAWFWDDEAVPEFLTQFQEEPLQE